MINELLTSLNVAVRTFCYSICTEVYKLIISLYNLFEMLCKARLLENSFVSELYARVGLILGLVMFFRVAFSFVQMLISPDNINDKEKGAFSIIKKSLVVIVLLGVTPFLFETAYDVQDMLLSTESGGNIVSRLVLPVTVDTDNFGAVLSENLLFSFYTLNEDTVNTDEYDLCNEYQIAMRNQIESLGKFDLGFNCLTKTVSQTVAGEEIDVFVINYSSIFSVVCGIAVCWFLLIYSFSVGVRLVQLTFLQIIAPMPIISYLSPKKDGMFQKWLKMCVTTYLDAFIRVAIINFVVLLIALVMDSFSDMGSVFWITSGATGGTKTVLFIVIILALLQFAKKAPELIKEFFPNSKGEFGFSLKNRDVLGKGFAVAGGVAAGSAIGLVSGFAGGKGFSRLTGALGGVLGGTGRGIIGGYRSKGASFGDITKGIGDVRKKQADYGLKRAQRIATGTDFTERFGDAAKGYFGIQQGYSQVDSTLSVFNNLNSLINDEDIVKDYEIQRTKANEELGKVQRDYDAGKVGIAELNAARDAYAKADARVSAAKEAVYKAALTGSAVNHIDGEWLDHTGVKRRLSETAIVEVGPNASIVASIENVEKVSGTKFATRKDFNTERKRLQGVSNTLHKNK